LRGVIARGVIEVGSEPEKALLLKTTSNFITAGLMFLISEAHVLAEKSGLPAPVLETLIQENFGVYAYGVSQRMTTGGYYPAAGKAPSSGLELGIKDLGHGLDVAKSVGMELNVGKLSVEAMEEAKAFGDGKGRKLDSSSVYGIIRQRAGLEFESKGVVEKRDTYK
jgi:3-hydroxyisobutyrate dehydrogenase-like beta-hydroxyacid dehydrogenase